MPNTKIEHPNGTGCIFGSVKGVAQKRLLIPGGVIYLKRGKHKGPNRGFGIAHIWAEHSKEVTKLLPELAAEKALDDFSLEEQESHVAMYVSRIVCAGSPIYCEFNGFGSKHKLAVVRTSVGTSILEHIEDRNDPHYSVVTAFSKKYAHGTLVSTVL